MAASAYIRSDRVVSEQLLTASVLHHSSTSSTHVTSKMASTSSPPYQFIMKSTSKTRTSFKYDSTPKSPSPVSIRSILTDRDSKEMPSLVQHSGRTAFSPTTRKFDRSNTSVHSSSKVWMNPRIREKDHSSSSISNRHVLNHARSQICRKSTFWTEDFDLKTHREAWAEGEMRRRQEKLEIALQEETLLRRSQSGNKGVIVSPPLLRPPFNNQDFSNNRGYVLGLETVFCPTFDQGSKEDNLAPWPSKAEAKYEGEDRISTDRLHRRFPGAPRVEAEGDGVAWNCLRIIEQFPFDDFYFPIPQAVEVFLRTHWVDDLEFDDDDGREILGQELFDVLDPQDQW